MILILCFAALIGQVSAQNSSTITNVDECMGLGTTSAAIITPDCIDPDYESVVIDNESDETMPISHRKISAHFEDTTIEIRLYLPPKEIWKSRFFQMVYPSQDADALNVNIEFGNDSGGYTVQINGTGGYRADAAAAKFSRQFAAEYYNVNDQHIFGYIYGGSGGSFQTVGGIENAPGIWDGAVPIVQAVPVSFMNNPSIRCMAGTVLRGKAKQVAAAVGPGGNGDPYSELSTLGRAMLREATLMGIPLATWEVFDSVGNCSYLDLFRGAVQSIDPAYAEDFWSKPGYLGTESSDLGALLRSLRITHITTISHLEQKSEGVFVLSLDPALPHMSELGLDFSLISSNGSIVGSLSNDLNSEGMLVVNKTSMDAISAAHLVEGATIAINNDWFIAMHAYYRHQVPSRSGFYGFDQFKDSSGNPIYPQRAVDASALVAQSASGGGTHTGNITGKIIVVGNLGDYDAFPWHADWYQSQVKEALGDQFDDNYRIWFNENADHNFGPVPQKWTHRVVDFTGIYHQALRDLSSWVERGVPAPRSTNYTVSEDNAVIIPSSGKERLGIQPHVQLKANRVHAVVGDVIQFTAHAEVPEGMGKIVSIEWDFRGSGDYVSCPFGAPKDVVDIHMAFTYHQAGVYQPVVRVVSHREGDPTNYNRRVLNLARIQIKIA